MRVLAIRSFVPNCSGVDLKLELRTCPYCFVYGYSQNVVRTFFTPWKVPYCCRQAIDLFPKTIGAFGLKLAGNGSVCTGIYCLV